jgi:hypothetical protein
VRAALAEAGVEATVYSDYAEDASRRKFGLGNLAAVCHNDNRGERAWRKIVENHVRTILSGMDGQSPFDTMPASGIFAATYLRLMPAEDVLPNMSYARPVAPGLAEVLNLDLPTNMSAVSVIARCVKPGSATSKPSRSTNMRHSSTTAARSRSCSVSQCSRPPCSWYSSTCWTGTG